MLFKNYTYDTKSLKLSTNNYEILKLIKSKQDFKAKKPFII